MKKDLKKNLNSINANVKEISKDQQLLIKGGSIVTEDLVDL